MTVSENEEAIYKQLNKNRLKLYATLSKKINIDTNNYFYVNDGTNLYYPDLENLNEFTFWNPSPSKPCPCSQFRNEGDGIVSFLGAVFAEGWENTETWEMVADIKFGRLWKTGLILITDADNPFPLNGWGSESSGRWGISAWERFIGTPYTLDGDPHYEITYEGDSQKFTQTFSSWADNVWHSLHMKKVSSTRLIVWLDDNENDRIIYDWEELSDVEKVTFGATMNHNTSDYGNCPSNLQNIRLYVRDLYVFYPSLPANRLTALCEDTKKIKCSTNNSATIPPTPDLVNGNTLAINEFNIHNKIQYCNNVLRYTLRKCGIDFTDEETNELSNEMHKLIKFINEILTTSTIDIDNAYSAYVNPIQLLGDKSIVQENETYNLIAEVVDKGAGISVDFIQKNQQLGYELRNSSNYITVTTDDTGTTFANNTNDNQWIWLNRTGTATDVYDWEYSSAYEFDLVSYTGSNTLIYANTSTVATTYKSFSQLEISGSCHIRVEITENKANYYVDDVLKFSMDRGTDKSRFGFRISANESFKFKNMKVLGNAKVYPVGETLFEDKGTTSSHNDNWLFRNCTDSIRTRDDNGTLLDVSSLSLSSNADVTPNTNSFYSDYIEPNTIVEFEVIDVDNTADIKINTIVRRDSSSVYPNINLKDYTVPFKVKIVYLADKYIFYVNNTIIATQSYDDIINYRSYFLFETGKGTYVKYRNFKMYETVETSTTDVNGIATCNILADGSGVDQYSAKYENIESNTTDVIDVKYYETVPNEALRNGYLQHQNIGRSAISLSNEWSTVGTHSIKTETNSNGWAGYRINNPNLTDNECIIQFDYKTNKITNIMALGLSSTENVVSMRAEILEGTGEIYFYRDISEPVTRIELRQSNANFDGTVTYFDNIKIFDVPSWRKGYIWYDVGTDLINRGSWSDGYANSQLELTSQGIHMTNGRYTSFYRNRNSHSLDGSKDTVIEFDFKTANVIAHYLVDNAGSRTYPLIDGGITDYNVWKHYKYVYHSDTKMVDVYVDGVQQTGVDHSDKNMATFGFQFVDWQANGDWWIKNFKVYPL